MIFFIDILIIAVRLSTGIPKPSIAVKSYFQKNTVDEICLLFCN